MNSSQCIGWWEQDGFGRQAMEDLVLAFGDSRISGSGHDIVGPFTLSGEMEANGRVRIKKQYTGRHYVIYIGDYDGEGTLFGTWLIDSLAGKWSIKLVRAAGRRDDFEEILPQE